MTKASCSCMIGYFPPWPDKYSTFTNKHGTGYEDLTELGCAGLLGTVMRTLRFTRALSAVAVIP